jgi:hypothetical protein
MGKFLALSSFELSRVLPNDLKLICIIKFASTRAKRSWHRAFRLRSQGVMAVCKGSRRWRRFRKDLSSFWSLAGAQHAGVNRVLVAESTIGSIVVRESHFGVVFGQRKRRSERTALKIIGRESYLLPLPDTATVRERALVTNRLRLTPSLSARSTSAW